MALILSVTPTILEDTGIQEGNSQDGPWAKIKFKVDWSSRYTLAQDLMGTWKSSGNTIIRTPPYPYPDSRNLWCQSIDSIEPFGKSQKLTSVASWWLTKSQAIVTAHFAGLKYTTDNSDPSGKPYTQTTINQTVEFLTLPQSVYRFGDGTPTPAPIGVRIPLMEINLKRYFMPYLPLSQSTAIVGKANNAAITLGNMTLNTGTVMHLGFTSDTAFDTTGAMTQEVEYKWIWRSVRWDYQFHPDRTTGWGQVTDGSGNAPVSLGDFTTLP